MKTIDLTAAIQDFSNTLDRVCKEHDPIVVTREDAEPVVIMSLQDFRGFEETAYLLRSPENARRLSESIQEINSGQFHVREMLE